jgi:hypothetical protein
VEILKILGIDKLDESQQDDVKQKLADIVDIRVAEKLSEQLDEAKTELVEEYEGKFEEYKQSIVTNFSNFVDQVLEEELLIPENIMEFARQGELYADLINEFKVRVGIDEGALDEEARSLLKEARDEIVSLRNQLNEATTRELEATGDAQMLALESYKLEKCLAVPTVERDRVMTLLEGASTKSDVDRKFKFLVENKMVDGVILNEDSDGKGRQTVVNEDNTDKGDGVLDEGKSPFESDMDRWVSRLKDNE